MDCLKDYIGIKVCGDEQPESGVFINSLPGISLESIDKIANEDQVTYAGVWSDVQDEAAVRFEMDFITQITRCFKLHAYCDYEDLICANKQKLLNPWRYLLGNQLMQFRLYTPRLNRFTTIDLDQAKQLLNFYQVEYEKALESAVKLVNTGDCCLECGGNPEYVTWLP
jgi:hypothetical protein